MKLQDFVKESLLQVINGVNDANAALDDNTGSINPRGRGVEKGRSVNGSPIQDVQFDVAISVTEGSEVGAGLTVMGIGAKAGLSESTGSISRIKFAVPVALPISQKE